MPNENHHHRCDQFRRRAFQDRTHSIDDGVDWFLQRFADFVGVHQQGFRLLATENVISQVNGMVAPMAIRFTPEVIGTQFHPEADAFGMLQYLKDDIRKENIIKEYGMKKYLEMMDHADDPDKIQLTHDIILPNFLNQAIENLKEVEVE